MLAAQVMFPVTSFTEMAGQKGENPVAIPVSVDLFRAASYWNTTGFQAFLGDFGRGRVTVRPEDRYKLRTPTLRNVELTAPYGHAGAYPTLDSVVRHHLAPVDSLERYSLADAILTDLPQAVELTASGSTLSQEWRADSRWDAYRQRDGWVQEQAELRNRIAEANELEPMPLSDRELGQLLAFLHSLTDDRSRDLSDVTPQEVPSGLAVED